MKVLRLVVSGVLMIALFFGLTVTIFAADGKPSVKIEQAANDPSMKIAQEDGGNGSYKLVLTATASSAIGPVSTASVAISFDNTVIVPVDANTGVKLSYADILSPNPDIDREHPSFKPFLTKMPNGDFAQPSWEVKNNRTFFDVTSFTEPKISMEAGMVVIEYYFKLQDGKTTADMNKDTFTLFVGPTSEYGSVSLGNKDAIMYYVDCTVAYGTKILDTVFEQLYLTSFTFTGSLLYGDVNNDGAITQRDGILLNQYLNGWDVQINRDNADVNYDGSITQRDIILLNQYLNGWPVKLGPQQSVVMSPITSNIASLSPSSSPADLLFSAADVAAKPGEYIEVPISVSNNPGFAGAEVRVSFDTDYLEWDLRNGPYNNIEQTTWPFTVGTVLPMSYAPTGQNYTNSGALFLFGTLSNSNVNGNLITLKLRVKEGAAEKGDSTTITISVLDVFDQVFSDVKYEIKNGVVTIIKPVVDDLLFSGEDKEAKPGDYIEVPISVSKNPGIAGAEVRVSFDTDYLAWDLRNGDYNNLEQTTWPFNVGNVLPMSYAPTGPNFTNAGALFLFGTLSNSNANGNLITLKLRIKDDAAEKGTSTTITISVLDVFDQAFNSIKHEIKNGVITIEKPSTYTVTYAPGTQGTFEPQVTSNLIYGAPTPAFVGTPTGNPGYTFAGWSPDLAATVTATVTYTAQWTQDKYTVTYAPGTQGTFTAQVTSDLVYGAATPAFVGTPTGNSGYTFNGWSPVPTATVTGTVTYTAQWSQVVTYTVTYAPGTQGTFTAQVTPGLAYGDPTPTAPEPTGNLGYTFTGWSPVPTATVTTTVTYTAQWTQDKYTVTYAPGTQGTFAPQVTSDLVYGAPTPAGPIVTGNPGYTFTGWSPVQSATVTATVTYTAQWTQDKYTVTYAPGTQGTFAPQVTSDLVYGAATPTFVGTPTGNPGYTFTGWSPVPTATVTGTVTYTAQWSQVVTYTVTYAPGTQGTFAPQVTSDLVYGAATPAFVGTPTGNSGYSFAGWSPVPTATVTATVTYTAQWTNITVTTITIKTQPKLVYNHNDKLDLSALVVTLSYNVGPSEDVPFADFAAKNITTDPAHDTVLSRTDHNSKPVAVIYNNSATIRVNTNNLTVNVCPITEAHITVTAPVVGAAPDPIAIGIGPFKVGSAEWNPGHNPFRVGFEYTVTVRLTAEDNYTFAGLKDATINGFLATISFMSGNSVVDLSYKFPVLTTDEYTITYVLNGGTNNTANPDKYTTAQTPITIQDPSKPGYNFIKWTEGNTIPAGSTGPKTFTAEWSEAIVYSISYVLNGGVNHADNPASYTVESPLITLKAPTRDGYDFDGWTPTDTIPTGSTGNKTFTANWKSANRYTITYILNSGTNHPDNPASYTVEDTPVTIKDPSRNGYTFVRWTEGNIIAAGATGNKTFTAEWSVIEYTITYVLNGGTNNPANPDKYTIEQTPITILDPSRSGYNFVRWTEGNTIAAGSTGNKTFTAEWSLIETFTVTYAPGTQGTFPPQVTSGLVNGDPTPAPPTTTGNSGYNFTGWSPEPTATVTGTVTYTAQWSAIVYTITYVLNGGTNNPANPASYTIEDTPVTILDPSRTGYNFVRWTEGNTIAAGSTGNKTFTAEFELTPVELVSIKVTTLPTKMVYNVYETLTLAGMVVTAYYSDGDSRPVTGYATDPRDGDPLNIYGTPPVTVTYTEGGITKTDTFNITVEANYLLTYSVVNGNGKLTATTNLGATPVPSGDMVYLGTQIRFTATPDPGYKVKEWKVNGNVVTGTAVSGTDDEIYDFEVRDTTDVTVEFELKTITRLVTFEVIGGNGTLTAFIAGGAYIQSGYRITNGHWVAFTAKPDALYRVKEWTLNKTLVNGKNLTYGVDVWEDIHVTVEFELIPDAPEYNFNIYVDQDKYIQKVGDTFYVDIMLWGDRNYTQMTAEILYDTNLLEYAGYTELLGWAASVSKSAANKVAVRNVPSMNMVTGASCSPAIRIVRLAFTAKGGFTGDSIETSLSFASALVSPAAGVVGTTTDHGDPVNITLQK